MKRKYYSHRIRRDLVSRLHKAAAPIGRARKQRASNHSCAKKCGDLRPKAANRRPKAAKRRLASTDERALSEWDVLSDSKIQSHSK